MIGLNCECPEECRQALRPLPLQRSLSNCAQLTVLWAENLHAIGHGMFKFLDCLAPTLQELHVARTTFTDSDLLAVSGFGRLKLLDICWCLSISPGGFYAALQKDRFSRLSSLRADGTAMDEKSVELAAEHLPALEHVGAYESQVNSCPSDSGRALWVYERPDLSRVTITY